jgi:EpsI family protein
VSVEGKIGAAFPSAETPSQPGLSRRHLLMGTALLAVSGLSIARTPKRRYPDLTTKQFEALFPSSFGNWQTLPVSELVMPPESDLANKLYQHIVTKTYVNGDASVMFLAAYNSVQLNNVQLHRPEVCYYAGGFSIDLSKPVDIQLPHNEVIPARTVTASLGSRHENILYWTRIGNEFPQSQVTQRISMTKANLEGYLADGLLLRMSVLNPDNKASIAQMTSFIEDLLAHSGAGTRRLITGVA